MHKILALTALLALGACDNMPQTCAGLAAAASAAAAYADNHPGDTKARDKADIAAAILAATCP